MTFKLRALTLSAISAIALATLAPATASATALKPGSYEIAGIQQICIVNGGTWYGETYPNWAGAWRETPSGQTAIYGNYNSGAGNDGMISTRSAVQWTEWSDDHGSQSFLAGSVARLGGKCSPPATMATTKKSPMH